VELEILKKKISTFRSEGGRVRITDDQLYLEILMAWELWTGSSKEFYRAIGVSKTGMAGIIGKAKRMRREGHFPPEAFKEVKIEEAQLRSSSFGNSPCNGIEVGWENGKLIRFQEVDQLIDFLKKVA
jgi:hypothetical protein